MTANQIEAIGATIRCLRKERRLTQTDLAALSGVGRRFVSDLENGKPTVRMVETLKVLQIFGLTLTSKRIEFEDRS